MLRWYGLYSETLVKEGFKINHYNKRVANKVIDGTHCTIVWYVDNNKVSHMNKDAVTGVIEIMKGYFGELIVMRGETYNFLSMHVKIIKNKSIEIEMKEQLREAITRTETIEGEYVIKNVTSPAQKHLRDTNDKCKKLMGNFGLAVILYYNWNVICILLCMQTWMQMR